MRPDFLALLAEYQALALSDKTPLDSRDALVQLAQAFNKCAWFVPKASPALAADDAVYFEPTNRFLSLIIAARANDWPQVAVLVHEIITLPVEPYKPGA